MGGGNCLFGTESIYRGKYSIVEVASDSFRTELPDMGTWKSGTLDTSLRCFDLLCTGKCYLTSTDLKLRVESVDKIPNFFTKNSEGKIVFSDPSPMSIITTPKGHGTWIQIELKTINGVASGSLSGIAKHICLGIKKRSGNDYFDVIHAAKLTSEYVDLFDTDAVELVPILSKTEVTSDSYELAKTGEEITPSDFDLTGTSFDFGSVYRVNINDHGVWIEKDCNLRANTDGRWYNYGSLGVGPIAGQNGLQLLAIQTNCMLSCSSDGISWSYLGTFSNNFHWWAGPTYGNGVWCIANPQNNIGIKRSIDQGKQWIDAVKIGAFRIAFGNDIFMFVSSDVISNGSETYAKVYTSKNAKEWVEIGVVPASASNGFSILIHGDGKWICGSNKGDIYHSKEGKKWTHIGDVSQTTKSSWMGGCYANGYFYVVNEYTFVIMRSATGEKWEEVMKLPTQCNNITYYKNKLYSVVSAGTKCYIGIPNP